MTLETLLAGLSDGGVAVALDGGDIKLLGPAAAITDDDVGILRDHKPDVLRLLRLADGLPVDDDAAALLAMDEVDPTDLPTCPTCGRLCDTQTLDDQWRCSPCDPDASQRRRRTEKFLRNTAAIRYTHTRNG